MDHENFEFGEEYTKVIFVARMKDNEVKDPRELENWESFSSVEETTDYGIFEGIACEGKLMGWKLFKKTPIVFEGWTRAVEIAKARALITGAICLGYLRSTSTQEIMTGMLSQC
jgi:hypothetical protein